jgi:hypothetical protein
MSANIFISFASQDLKVASTICSAIEGRGFKCWISSRDILPGENFQSAIVRAIRGSRIMLLVFTGNSNRSEEMTKELALASQQKLMVVPLRVEDVTPSDAFAYEFATRQWIDLFADWEMAMNQLCARIAAALANEPHSTDTIVLGKPSADMPPATSSSAATPAAPTAVHPSTRSAAANAPLPFAKPLGKSASVKTAASAASKPVARKRLGGLAIGGVALLAAGGIAIALSGKGGSAPAPAADVPAPASAAAVVADAPPSAAPLVVAAAEAPAASPAAVAAPTAEAAEAIPATLPTGGPSASAAGAPRAPATASAAAAATSPAIVVTAPAEDPAKAAQRRKQRLANKAHASSNVPY